MAKDREMSEMVRNTKIGRGRRVAILVAAVVLVAVLIGVVVAGFRGRHISQNAAAMTTPVAAAPAKVAWRPWWLP
jgi:flagellar basal body-associated protein FliL